MHTYMNARDLHSFTDADLYFMARAYATRYSEYDDIIHFLRTDETSLLQIIDSARVFECLTDRRQIVLPVSTFCFFLLIIRHAFLSYVKENDFKNQIHAYKESKGKGYLEDEQIDQFLMDLSMHLYLANLLTFFSESHKMNDPQKTQNGWLYIFEMMEKLKTSSPVNEFYIKAFIGNYTLCLTGLYKEYVQAKYDYGKRLVDCEYYAGFGEKFFASASKSPVAEDAGLSHMLHTLALGFNVVRFALDRLKYEDHFFGLKVS